MTFISVTRLRIRAIRFLPGFAFYALKANRQVSQAKGFRGGFLLTDRHWTFWTLTSWDSEESMRRYMTSGAHRKAMPKLIEWCDEASVVHWLQPDVALPSWPDADLRMRKEGRPSKLRHPSNHHLDLSYRPPKTRFAEPIRPSHNP